MYRKKLTDADLGWGSSHQTHIGLYSKMIKNWSNADKEYECILYVGDLSRPINCIGVINAITRHDGSITSPKLKTGDIPAVDKNLLYLLRQHSNEERRFLTLGEIADGRVFAYLGSKDCDLRKLITSDESNLVCSKWELYPFCK